MIGTDNLGKLGLGPITSCTDLTIVPQLSQATIEDFYEGVISMFARTDKNEIFKWGLNSQGLMIEVQKIDYFDDKKIINLSCGSLHYLTLSSDGKIYGCGGNSEGQIGCGQDEKGMVSYDDDYMKNEIFKYHYENNPEFKKCYPQNWTKNIVHEPIQIEVSNEIFFKYIHCNRSFSAALDLNGNLYYWGKHHLGESTQWTPKKLNIKQVSKVISAPIKNQCIVLKESGNIFVYCIEQDQLISTLNTNFKVLDICLQLEFSPIIQTNECVYIGLRNEVHGLYIANTNSKNFYDFFNLDRNITYKTIHVITEENEEEKVKYLITNEVKYNQKFNHPDNFFEINFIEKKKIHQEKLLSYFNLSGSSGKGAFGDVKKVVDKITGDMYAIKKVEQVGSI